MTDTDPIDRLRAFLDGDEAAADEIRERLARWLRDGDGVPLASFLGLPDRRPRRVRIELRDAWLREAAALLVPGDACPPWERARALKAALRQFCAFRWPAWRHLDGPPLEHCTRFEACAWYALAEHDEVPATIAGFARIVRRKNSKPEISLEASRNTMPVDLPPFGLRKRKVMTTTNDKRDPVRVRALRPFFVDAKRIAKPGDELELDFWVAQDAIGAKKAEPVYAPAPAPRKVA